MADIRGTLEWQNLVGRDAEGLNTLYKLSALTLLTYASRYPSLRFGRTYRTLVHSIRAFENVSRSLLSLPSNIGFEELLRRRLMKRKHYYYGTYLAVLSSLPILWSVMKQEDLISPVLAKTAEIVSIKTLDNINDVYHTRSQALRSLDAQFEAFTQECFNTPPARGYIHRAENSAYRLARLTYRLTSSSTDADSPIYRMYIDDLKTYMRGQKESMRQKEMSSDKIDIRTFLIEVNEKGVGNVWVDVDFCFLDGHHALTEEELEEVELIKKAIDLIFKGCNVYDDIADLHTDISEGILNSVCYLALDRGHCSESDLTRDPSTLVRRLERSGAFEEAVELGDLLFLKGIETLKEAKKRNRVVDIDALVFNANVLRIFAIRKWLISSPSLKKAISVSCPKFSESLAEYYRYIR